MMGRKLKVALGKPKDQSKPDKWQKKPEKAGESAGVVMQSRPRRGIPQSELNKLQKLRDSLGKMKVSDDDGSGAVKKATAKTAINVSRLQMVDVGANLTNFRYRENVEQVISRALSSGVHKMIIASSTLEDAQQALILAETLPGVLYCTVGVHPHEAKQWTPESGVLLRSLLDHPQVVAVGECGLDYFRMLSSTNKQLEAFEDQIVIACQTKKPLFVHDRDSHSDLTDKLLSHKASLPPTLIHCFTGTRKEADFYIQRGFYIGITGFVSKPDKGAELRSILKDKVIPLDRLVIETDCPFMMPNIPKEGFQGMDFTDIKQGRNNEPCTLVLVADTIAKCYGVSLEEVVETTTRNAIQLFNL
ncbi:3'-5' ssDNA/RNA exonuclease TatD-like isoform X2 [Dysidea avara]